MNSRFNFLFQLAVLFCFFLVSCSTDEKNSLNEDDASQQQSETESEDTPVEIGLKDINTSLRIGGTIAPLLDNSKYMNIHSKEFNAGQALWYAGFGGWPAESSFDYANFNKVVNWMVDNKLSPHNHMLVGPNFYMPEWLLSTTWTDEELDTHLKSLVQGIMESNDNKNKVDVWNVINEVFNQDGTYRSQGDMLWNQLGFEDDNSGLVGENLINERHPIFIGKAFSYAREKTNKILEYRDYLIEATNPDNGWDKKHKAVYQLLKHLQNSDIPIDAIGIQGHYDIGNSNWVLENNRLANVVEKFKALNLEVYITELDIGSQDLMWTDALAERQKDDYYAVVKQVVEGGASRIYTWGIQDGLDKGWRTNEHPLPWDENLDKKPAYFGIKAALEDTRN